MRRFQNLDARVEFLDRVDRNRDNRVVRQTQARTEIVEPTAAVGQLKTQLAHSLRQDVHNILRYKSKFGERFVLFGRTGVSNPLKLYGIKFDNFGQPFGSGLDFSLTPPIGQINVRAVTGKRATRVITSVIAGTHTP